MPRRAEPTNVLEMKGKKHLTKSELQRRRDAEQALKPRSDKVKPPAWLDKVGKQEWKRVCDELKRLELLTNVDVTQLAIYCDAVSRYVEATVFIQQNGLTVEHTNKGGATNEVLSPYVQAAGKYAQIIRQFVAEFGLTPSARARLALPGRHDKPKDRFEELFG